MTLLPTRKVAGAFVGVFLIGALVGALLVKAFEDLWVNRFLVSTADPKSMAVRIDQKYLHDYHLTPDEELRIRPLIQEMTQQLYLSRKRFGVDIISTMDDYHNRIAEQMLPEHRDAYKEANDKRRKRMSSVLLLDQAATDSK